MFVSGLFPKPILCFVLVCGIRVASKSSVDSLLFLSGVLILLCEYQSFLIIEIVMPILFQPTCSFSSGSDHFNIREINSQFFTTVFVSSVPSCLCFPALPPFFFKDSYNLIKYPSIDGKSLHSFSSMFLSGDSQEDTNGALTSSLFVLFLL